MINEFGAYLGMGLLAVTVAILWFLADKEDLGQNSKKSKRNYSLHKRLPKRKYVNHPRS